MQQATNQIPTWDEIQRRLEQIYELPAMPDMAQRLLMLRNDPNASAADLGRLVELDPSLAAQVVHYATSPFFGYRGKVESIRDAVSRVLGFDMVVNMALGLATSRSFRNPPDGPLGLNAFWRHSVYTAVLVQSLAAGMPRDSRPKPGMAYLAGLLHNFGFLLLGHLFPPEFQLLNKLVAANPDTPVMELEKRVLGMGQAQDCLGMGHAQVGAWLMAHWGMPGEITVSLREHHNPEYDGEHAVYARLVQVADHLLKRYGIGDAPHGELPEPVMARLGLSEAQALEITTKLLESAPSLDAMARQLSSH
ncbi:MAG TPA: HDOD domain-containing protein [Gammaproteobacteria bacterium]|nr:HDOD domain-containing protein [Gammaproteobacteria bacterium]